MLTLQVQLDRYAIHRLPGDAMIPPAALGARFCAITRTAKELSLVLPMEEVVESDKVSTDWRALEVLGPLDFGLTGILAGLAGALADANISLFAISTFDTDWLLVKDDALDAAISALRGAGYRVETLPNPTAFA